MSIARLVRAADPSCCAVALLYCSVQVEVLALPYYLGGKLVDVRYLQLSGGQLVGSWLAVGAGAVYMREQEAKARGRPCTRRSYQPLAAVVGLVVWPATFRPTCHAGKLLTFTAHLRSTFVW